MSNEIEIKEILGNKYVQKLVRETFDDIVKKKQLSIFSTNFTKNVNGAKTVEEAAKKVEEAAKQAAKEAKQAAEAAEKAKQAILSELQKGNTIVFNSFVDSIPNNLNKSPSIEILKQIKELIATDIDINLEINKLTNLSDEDNKIINGIGDVLTKHQELILNEQIKPTNFSNLLQKIKKKMEQLNKIMNPRSIKTGGSNMKQQLLTDLHYITKYLKYKTKYIVFKSNN